MIDKDLIPYIKIGYKANCWVTRKGCMWLDRGIIKDVIHSGIVISLSECKNRNKKPEMYKGDFIVKWKQIDKVYKILDAEKHIIMEIRKGS